MSSIELGDRWERHEYLPTAVNWIGTWSPSVVYFKNDVVVSPINTGSYIMIGPTTTFQGGDDPSIPSNVWFPFGQTIGTVQTIRAGTGIELTGNSTNPSVANTGVLSVVPGTGINNIGTDTIPILTVSGITGVVQGVGISVIGIPNPEVSNTGVVELNPGAGMDVIYPTGNGRATVVNKGLTGLTEGGGISVAGGQIKTIGNTGLLTINAGGGIINNGTPTEPDLENGGVITITPLNHSITVSGNPLDVKLASNNSRKTAVWSPTVATTMTPNPIGVGIGLIPLTQTPGTLWASCLATGAPFNSGIFTLQIPFTFKMAYQFSGLGFQFQYSLYDSIENKEFVITYRAYPLNASGANRIILYKLGSVRIDLAAIRAAGLRQITGFRMYSGTVTVITLQDVGGTAFATFYPTND
jgi:hypothetical protein